MITICMLSYIPGGVQPVQSHLENGADSNPDGHGYAIIIPGPKNLGRGELVTGHSMNPVDAIRDFMTLRKMHPDGPAMFHSRIGTGGTVSVDNCHPYTVHTRGGFPDSRTVLGHNGIMFLPDKGEKRSDTRIFAEDIVPWVYRRLDRPGVQENLHTFLGRGNKVLFLTVNPYYARTVYLFGEEQGQWVTPEGDRVYGTKIPDGSTWHSNAGWRAPLKNYGGWGYGVTYTGSRTGRKKDRKSLLDCGYCLSQSSVDAVSAICSECMLCADCGTLCYDCLCWVPASTRNTTATSA